MKLSQIRNSRDNGIVFVHIIALQSTKHMLHIASLCAWRAKQLQLIIRRSVVTPSLWRARIVCNVEKIPDRVQLHSVAFLIQILRSCLLTSAFPHLSIKNQKLLTKSAVTHNLELCGCQDTSRNGIWVPTVWAYCIWSTFNKEHHAGILLTLFTLVPVELTEFSSSNDGHVLRVRNV